MMRHAARTQATRKHLVTPMQPLFATNASFAWTPDRWTTHL